MIARKAPDGDYLPRNVTSSLVRLTATADTDELKMIEYHSVFVCSVLKLVSFLRRGHLFTSADRHTLLWKRDYNRLIEQVFFFYLTGTGRACHRCTENG